MDQLILKLFTLAETTIKTDHLIRSKDGSVSVAGQREGSPSPYISELNRNYSRPFRRRERVSKYSEECGNKNSGEIYISWQNLRNTNALARQVVGVADR